MTSARLIDRTRVLLLAGGVLTVLVAAAIGTPERALAQGGACGVHTLRGSFTFAASGYNIVAGVAQPKAIVEDIRFNGDGTLDVWSATVSINGNIVNVGPGGVGVYDLDDQCRGTLTFTGGPSFAISTDQKGRQGWMIQTNPNSVFQGTVTKTAP